MRGCSSSQWGDEGHRKGYCLYKMGCKGPSATFNCPNVRWNDGTSWPVRPATTASAVRSQDFWANASPFYARLPNVPGFGADTTAETVGSACRGRPALTAAHAVGKGVQGALAPPSGTEDAAPAGRRAAAGDRGRPTAAGATAGGRRRGASAGRRDAAEGRRDGLRLIPSPGSRATCGSRPRFGRHGHGGLGVGHDVPRDREDRRGPRSPRGVDLGAADLRRLHDGARDRFRASSRGRDRRDDPPPNAELVRNLIAGSQLVHDHVVHFYHLHALDWVDVTVGAEGRSRADVAPRADRSLTTRTSSPTSFSDVIEHGRRRSPTPASCLCSRAAIGDTRRIG